MNALLRSLDWNSDTSMINSINKYDFNYEREVGLRLRSIRSSLSNQNHYSHL